MVDVFYQLHADTPPQPDMAERRKTYRRFVRASFTFTAHVVVILIVLAWFFF